MSIINENDIKEALAETEKPISTEASMSVTIQAYYKGFSVLITKRDPEAIVRPLVAQAMRTIDYMIKLDFKPSWNQDTNKQFAETRTPERPNEEEIPPFNDDEFKEPITREPVEQADFCQIHKIQMKERKGQYGPFFSHAKKLSNGKFDYCSGKGFKTDQVNSSSY